MLSTTAMVLGGDLALIRASSKITALSLDELKLTQVLDQNSVDNGGIVTSYVFKPYSLN